MESLPLFSAQALDWNATTDPPAWLRKPLEVRERYRDCIIAAPGREFRLIDAGDRQILSFRCSGGSGHHFLIVVANSDMEHARNFRVSGMIPAPGPTDLLSGISFPDTPDGVEGRLEPGQVVIFVGTGN